MIPRLYHQYRHLFDAIFGGPSLEEAAKEIPELCHVLTRYWRMVKARNEVFCGALEENSQLRIPGEYQKLQVLKQEEESAEKGSLQVNEDQIIRTLDSLGRYIDDGCGIMIDDESGWIDLRGRTAKSMANLILGSAARSVCHIVSILCRWATNGARYGDWRPYLVASILLKWRGQDPQRKVALQDALIQWLDAEAGRDAEEDRIVEDTLEPMDIDDGGMA